MATFTGSRGGGSTGPYLTLDYNVVETDVANNRSKVRLVLKLNASHRVNFSASKSGVLQGSSFTYTSGASGTGSWTLRSQDVWVGHNSDGSKSQSFSGSFNIAISYSGSNVSSLSVSGTATLPVIPRASTISAFSFASHLQPSTAVTINYTVDRKSGNFRHQIQLRDGSHTVQTWDNISSNGASALTLSTASVNSLLNRMSSVTTRSLTLRVATRSGVGGGWIGSAVTRNATATVHADVKPTVGAVSLSQTGNSVSTHYLQGKSKVKASFTRSAGYGASISSSSIQVRRVSGGADSQTINSNDGTTNNPVTLNGSYQARGIATDSRGRFTHTAWATFTVTAYSAPRITNFTAVRSSSAETTIVVTRNGTHTSLGSANSARMLIQKRTGTGAWTTVEDTSDPSGSWGKSVNSTGNSVSSSYEFRATLTDAFGESATASVTVSTQRVVLDIHKNEGVGIGKIHERGVLDVDGEVYLNGKVMALGGLGFEDTRSINDQPQQIPPRAFSFSFKNASTIGSPPERANNTYAHILNIAGWSSSEPSGGYPMQMSIGGEGISLRQGTSPTAWSNWKSLGYIESGQNGNGDWYRFSNGLQVCVGTFSHNFATSQTKYVLLPASFSTTLYSGFISASIDAWLPTEQSSAVGVAPSSSTSIRFSRYGSASHTRGDDSAIYRYIAIGRWK